MRLLGANGHEVSRPENDGGRQTCQMKVGKLVAVSREGGEDVSGRRLLTGSYDGKKRRIGLRASMDKNDMAENSRSRMDGVAARNGSGPAEGRGMRWCRTHTKMCAGWR